MPALGNKLHLYLETTVFNYYFDNDREGHGDVARLLESIGSGQFAGYASEYVLDELRAASEPKRSNMLALIERYGIITLANSPTAEYLANLYIQAGVIPASHPVDSLHIATASVYRLDCVVSYNFAHINRNKTRIKTTNINNDAGYGGVIICTAKEVLSDE